MNSIKLLSPFILVPLVGFAQDRQLDPSFGTNGIVTTAIGIHDANATSVALQSDGKIIAGGTTTNYPGWSCAAARYLANGSLDLSFGNQGTLIADSSLTHTLYTEANAMVLQPDGKIILGGDIYVRKDSDLSVDFLLMRYNSDGTIDSSFSEDGIAYADPPQARGYAMAIQPDGKIILAGTAYSSASDDFAIARFNASGSLDSSFGFNGFAVTDIHDSSSDELTCMALIPDGKFIAGGVSTDKNSGEPHGALLRFDAAGKLDSSFGVNGRVVTDYNHINGTLYGIALQPDGKIVTAGSSTGNFAIARYNSNGQVDSSFGENGIMITIIVNDEYAQCIALQADGKVVAAGYAKGLLGYDFTTVRYQTNGIVDSTFGANGIDTTHVDAGSAANAIAIQPDQRIVEAGGAYDFASGVNKFGLVRYLNDQTTGVLDINGPQEEIQVAPNPAIDFFTLQVKDQGSFIQSLQLFDLTGEKLMEMQNIHSSYLKINRGELPPGMYLIKTLVNGRETVRKIIFE